MTDATDRERAVAELSLFIKRQKTGYDKRWDYDPRSDIVAVLSALEAAEAEREQWKRHAATSDKEVAAFRTTVLTIIEALDVIPAVAPSLLWSEALPAILKRIEEVVDAANDDHAKLEAAEADARQRDNEIDKAIWICALDRVAIDERVEWTQRMRRQYDATVASGRA